MNFSEHISQLLSSTEYGSRDKAFNSVKSWISQDATLYVSNAELYNECLEEIYEFNEIISSKFSRKTVFELIDTKIPKLKAAEEKKVAPEEFFETLLSVESRNLTITSPISGIRLDGDAKEFSISPYKFGCLNDLEFPIANEIGLYISVEIKGVYDKNIAISKAENAFLDFARLIVFMSGKLDHSILVSTGLPLMPSYSHELMYVKTSSYQVADEQGALDFNSISNKSITKIPVNNEFFCNNEAFNKLWGLNNRRINGPRLNDIDSRIINSAIALGESALTADKKTR